MSDDNSTTIISASLQGGRDITGLSYGKLVVLGLVKCGKTPTLSKWLCQCDCGNKTIVYKGNLSNKNTQSCGCLKKIPPNLTHGLSKTHEYASWLHMMGRCLNPNNDGYSDYGGRGITVCERWQTFENFLADMGPKPSPRHSIDRFPDNDGNYEPSNCRWATQKEQCQNTRNCHFIEFNGMKKNITEWAEYLGVSRQMLYERLGYGWSPERVLTQPARKQRLPKNLDSVASNRLPYSDADCSQ